jgi:inorganic pyrophosphatase
METEISSETLEELTSANFWDFLDRLIKSTRVRIDRPGGSRHLRFPEIKYPLDYGYLEGTTAADGGGIDVWMGVSRNYAITAIIVTVDLLKRDTEIKILLGCTEDEIQTILDFHNQKYMRAMLVRRPYIQGECT